MRRRSLLLAAVAAVIVAASVILTGVIRADISRASGASDATVVPADGLRTDGPGRTPAAVGASGGDSAADAVTVPPLRLTASALPSTTTTAGSSELPTTLAHTTRPRATPARATGSTAPPSTAASSTPVPSTTPPMRSTATTSATPGSTRVSVTSVSSYHDTITPAATASADQIQDAVAPMVKAAAAKGITESVVVQDRHTGRRIVSIDAGRPVPAVSIAKLLFATDELDQAGGGSNLDQDDAQGLFDMISESNDDLADDYYGYHGESAIVQRVAQRYHLSGTSPAPNPRYWGGITVTAADIASLLQQALSDPAVGPYLAAPMKAATRDGADGYDQEFGMNAVVGAGSKQGWGCCLGGVVAIHSAGFTSRDIVVVLSTAAPDAGGLDVPQVSAFQHDPGFEAAVAAVTATARAAVDPGG